MPNQDILLISRVSFVFTGNCSQRPIAPAADKQGIESTERLTIEWSDARRESGRGRRSLAGRSFSPRAALDPGRSSA
ncbi:hypothetical protein J6590_026317 [Homalodisca vitripennis]|nr:hypothetical protein J6590_026317 [Homalodisca vitripennis]